MSSAGGCTPDEQRQLETLTLHFAGYMHHLVQRRCDQSTQANQVRLFRLGTFQDLFARDHDPQVDDLIVVAGEHHANDVLADVVNVAFDRCQHDFSLCLDHFAGRRHRYLLRFHERSQVGHRLLHYPGRLDDLGQEHLARSKQIAHHAHARHQRAFDHQQGAPELDPGFLCINFYVGINAFDQGVGKTFLDGAAAPFFGLLFSYLDADALEGFAVFHQPFGRVGTAVEQHVFDQHLQLRVDLFINLEHAGIHNAHVHARLDGVIEKGGVHGFTHFIVAAKAEGDVRHAAAHLGVRQVGLDPAGSVDKVNRVVVVLLHAGGNGEDVGIEDDVFWRESDFVDQEPVSTLADADLIFVGRGLAPLVEGHHDGRRAILQHRRSVVTKLLFAFFE